MVAERLLETSEFEALKETHDEPIAKAVLDMGQYLIKTTNGTKKTNKLALGSLAGLIGLAITVLGFAYNVGGWKTEVEKTTESITTRVDTEVDVLTTALRAEVKRSTDIDIRRAEDIKTIRGDMGKIKTEQAVLRTILERIDRKIPD